MPEDLTKIYKDIKFDSFPNKMEISFIENNKRQTLIYEKVIWNIAGEKKGLRYGENPSQKAALYKLINGNIIFADLKCISDKKYLSSNIELLQSGKHPSKTNITDTDNALNILKYFTEKPACVIVKHNNPSGVAQKNSLLEAYEKAYMADRVAAFGCCVAFNRTLDKETTKALLKQFSEVVVAPDFEEGVLELLQTKKNLRIFKINNIDKLHNFLNRQFIDFKSLIDGGIIVQDSLKLNTVKKEDLTLASCVYKDKNYKINRVPTNKEYEDMFFGWFIESAVSSNSVIYVKDNVTVGIGTGEQDRVGVAKIARDKAYLKLADKYSFEMFKTPYNFLTDEDKKEEIIKKVKKEKGGLINSIMVSDAFFPFRDGVDVGLKEKVSGIIQPGGSVNDYQSIEACNENNATMVYTKERLFKH